MKHWKFTLAFVAVFAAGLVVGSLTTMRFFLPPFGHPPGSAEMAERIMKKLKSELSLTSEQTTRIEPIVQQTTTKTVAFHRELSERLDATLNASDQEIEALLDADQKARFAKIRASRPHFGGKP